MLMIIALGMIGGAIVSLLNSLGQALDPGVSYGIILFTALIMMIISLIFSKGEVVL